MDYKSTVYKECLEIAEELLKEDYIKSELPLHIRDYMESDTINELFQESIVDLSELDIITQGEELLKAEIKADNYKTEQAKLIDIEWLEAFSEWRDIYNEKLLAKSRVF